MTPRSLFEDIAPFFPEELTQTLVNSRNTRIERIVSKGHISPPDFWYEQEENEFVVVLKGEGHLLFEDGSEAVLNPGDWIDIPAGKRHRVSYTSPDEATVWLAVFYL